MRTGRARLQSISVAPVIRGGAVLSIRPAATQTGKDHYRCFRRFEAHRPVALWGTRVAAGTYYVTTEDQIVETADQPPADVREPLGPKAALTT